MNERAGWSWQKGCGISCLGLLIIAIVAITALFYIAERANRPPSITLPPLPKPPSPNAHDDWVQAGTLAAGIRPMGPLSDARPVSTWTVAELKEFVDANREPLAIFHSSLDKDNLYRRSREEVHFQEHPYLRELARRVAGEAYYHEQINQPEEAMQIRLDLIEMGVRLPKNGIYITHLVGDAIVGIGMADIAEVLPHLDQGGLLTVLQRLDEIDAKRPPMSQIALEDAYTTAQMVQQAFHEASGTRVAYSFWTLGADSRSTTPLEEFRLGLRFVLLNKEAVLRQSLQDAADVAPLLDGPYDPNIALPQSREPLLMTYFFDGMWWSNADQGVQLALLKTEAALRLYRKDFGRYPKSLKDLTPEYLEEVPVDWYGGKPLKYKPVRNGQEFLLYSVGKNLKDEGGKALPGKGTRVQPDVSLPRSEGSS